jgi:hypothetical protein
VPASNTIYYPSDDSPNSSDSQVGQSGGKLIEKAQKYLKGTQGAGALWNTVGFYCTGFAPVILPTENW